MNTVINTLNNLSRSKDELLVELWEITVTDSVFSAAHGEFDTIKEIHVPSLDLCINRHRCREKRFNKFVAIRSKRYIIKEKLDFVYEKNPSLIKTFHVRGEEAECLRMTRKLIDNEEKYCNIINNLYEY